MVVASAKETSRLDVIVDVEGVSATEPAIKYIEENKLRLRVGLVCEVTYQSLPSEYREVVSMVHVNRIVNEVLTGSIIRLPTLYVVFYENGRSVSWFRNVLSVFERSVFVDVQTRDWCNLVFQGEGFFCLKHNRSAVLCQNLTQLIGVEAFHTATRLVGKWEKTRKNTTRCEAFTAPVWDVRIPDGADSVSISGDNVSVPAGYGTYWTLHNNSGGTSS